MATAKKPTSLKPVKPVKPVKAVKAVKAGKPAKASAATEKVKTAKPAKTTLAVTPAKASKPAKLAKTSQPKAAEALKSGASKAAAKPGKAGKTTKASKPGKPAKSAKPAKPPVVKWKPQKFVVSHLQASDFKAGLRSYAHYRDLGVAEATGGAVQAHVIRLLGKCDPSVVAIEHYHGVQFQLVYLLKGWMIGEYEGQGKIKMKAGSCWIQPNGIRHTVLDYSPDCEMVEIILPGDFKTVTLG
jgi:hypothetical protein